MKRKYYKVGRHIYSIEFVDGKNDDSLLPSSEPFVTDAVADDDLLFQITVDDNWRPTKKGREIGQFDCGGNNHGVYMLEDGSYQIVVSNINNVQCCLLQANADFTCANVCLNGNAGMRSFGLNNALMMIYAFSSSVKDTLLMHASVVRKDGRGYLCLGVSGTGKSTHTSLWLKHIDGTDLMNDDNPVVRICEDGIARVFGSPWSGKTPCYRDVEAPIGGFLQLEQAPYNKIRRQSVIEALTSLLPSCSVMKWDKRDYLGVCNTVKRLIELVPEYHLANLPNEDACRLSCSTMTSYWDNK